MREAYRARVPAGEGRHAGEARGAQGGASIEKMAQVAVAVIVARLGLRSVRVCWFLWGGK